MLIGPQISGPGPVAVASAAMTTLMMMLLAVATPPPSPAAFAEMAAPAGGSVGFAALDLSSGRTLGWHESDAFPMQSVFKLPIAIEVLRQVDAKKLDLGRVVVLGPSDRRDGPPGTMAVPARKTLRELLEAMLTTSDNVACDKLLALVGGPGVVDARVRALGVDHVTIRYTELDLHTGKVDNTATPAAMVALLAKIARRDVGLSAASATLLEDTLLRVTTGPQRIKGALPPGTPVAHKTGMSDTRDGKTDATNDVGLIALPGGNRVAVAVFVHASPADIATRERTIARLARAAYDAFDAPPLVAAALAAPAASARRPSVAPAAYFVKSAASLADVERTLHGKGAHGADLLKPGSTSIEIVLRHEDDYEQAELELHDGKDHIFFVTDGQATLTLGGELVAPREISPGEWKAAKATNARAVDVARGDLVFIPHGTVHGRSAKGRRFTMVIVSFFAGGLPGGPPPPAPAK
jgi:beta-lactamase class A/mannose-6-phosphate isomerase-like protein (cupin superfamily)